MEKKKIPLSVFLTAILLIAIIHSFFHIAVYGSGIDGVYKSGISGFAIGGIDSSQIKTQHPTLSGLSFNIVGIEWMLFITLVLFAIVTKKMDSINDSLNSNISRVYTGSNTKTDLDVLYEMLKTSGSIKVSAAAKLFNVDEDQVMEWSRILESAELASIYYPRIGEAEIALKN